MPRGAHETVKALVHQEDPCFSEPRHTSSPASIRQAPDEEWFSAEFRKLGL